MESNINSRKPNFYTVTNTNGETWGYEGVPEIQNKPKIESIKFDDEESFIYGKHVTITPKDCISIWPLLDNKQSLCLDDGKIFTISTHIGEIDCDHDIRKANPKESLIGYSIRLIRSFEASIKILSKEIQEPDSPFYTTEFFGGCSILANIAERFGFTVFDIEDDSEKTINTLISSLISSLNIGGNMEWRKIYEKNCENPQAKESKVSKVAIISREKLIKLYGVKY